MTIKVMKAALALGLALLALPAQAATCWSDNAYQAAQLKDLDIMLMVATLRCRISDLDFSADYNRFVKAKREILADANNDLRGQFAQLVGDAGALGAYDDYATKIANGYGGGAKGMRCIDFAALTRAAADAPEGRATLVSLAEAAGSAPSLPGQRCGMKIAMAVPEQVP
jgi:hypothetical protein